MIYLTVCMALLTQVAPSEEFEAFFKEFAEKRDAIRTIEATFVQNNITPDEIYTSQGSLSYSQPRQLLFRYDDPEPQKLLFDQGLLYEYDIEVRQLVIRRLDNMQEAETLFLAFENNPERLRELYDVAVAPPATTEGTACNGRVIILRPKADAEDPLFQRAMLYLREQDFLPCRIHIETDEDTQFFIDISDYKVNQPLAADALTYTLDSGVTVVVDEELADVGDTQGLKVPADVPKPAETATSAAP